MGCITELIPPELWSEILTQADNHTLTKVAQVSKAFSEVVLAILYKDLGSPMPLIRLLNVNMAYNVSDGFVSILGPIQLPHVTNTSQALEMPIIDQQLLRLRHVATHILHFSWTEDSLLMCSECCAIASTHIYDKVTGDLFPRLQSVHASCTTSYGVQVFLPWLSKPLSTVDIAFGPEVDDINIISCLLRLRHRCIGLTSFRLTLDCSKFSERRGVIDALVSAVIVMQKLRHVSLPSDLATPDLLDALAGLSTLHRVDFTPATSPVVWSMVYAPSILFSSSDNSDSRDSRGDLDQLFPDVQLQQLPAVPESTRDIPVIETSRFYALHYLRLSAKSWREVKDMVKVMSPYDLRELVIDLPPGQSQDERAAAFQSICICYPDVKIHLSE